MKKNTQIAKNIAISILFLLISAFLTVYAFKLSNPEKEPSDISVETDESVSEAETTEVSNAVKFTQALSYSNRNKTTETFDSTKHILLRQSSNAFNLTADFSLSEKTVSVPVTVPDEVYETYTVIFEDKAVLRPQIEFVNGLAVIDRGERLECYSEDGNLITNDLVYEPTFLRDEEKNQIFKDNNCFLKLKGGKFEDFDIDILTYPRIVSFENSPSLAYEDDKITRVQDAESLLWALADADGNLLCEAKYKRIYSFSEGLAAAVDSEDVLSFIDKNGNTVIEGRVSFRSSSDRFVDRVYATSGSSGEDCVGHLYFDNGIVLVREKIVDVVYTKNVISDYFAVIDKNGNHLNIPSDYTPKSSSNGVVVVEKDGKYGVYSNDDRFIIHPIYDKISPFYEGLAVIEKAGKKGLCDTLGNMVVPIEFDYISNVSNATVALYNTDTGFVILEKCTITK